MNKKILRLIPLIIVILFVTVVRIRLLDFPLERDEGEYGYMGQLILRGLPPYRWAYNPDFPGIYYVYALILALFGQTAQGIHLGLLLVNIATIILIFLLGKKLVNDTVAIISSATYALLSLSHSVLGFAAHATHFLILPAIAGFILLLKAFDSGKRSVYFSSGVLFGLAIFMKQPGVFFAAFGLSAIFYNQLVAKPLNPKKLVLDVFVFSVGSLLPVLVIFFLMYINGVFGIFCFWAIKYPAKYISQIPISLAAGILKFKLSLVIDGFYLLWIVSGLGLAALIIDDKFKRIRALISLFVLFSFLAVSPGFYFRFHYFIALLPAVAILVGIFFGFLENKAVKSGYLIAGLFLALMTMGIAEQRDYLFLEKPEKLSRKIYGLNPFPESVEIAKFIQSRTDKNDTIAVMGSEPQLYFYSKRLSATGHICTYELVEKHEYSLTMQEEMIREIESAQPKLFIFANIPTSWLLRPDSQDKIFKWTSQYLPEKYRLVGIVDILPNLTVYKWGDGIGSYKAISEFYVYIFERKS